MVFVPINVTDTIRNELELDKQARPRLQLILILFFFSFTVHTSDLNSWLNEPLNEQKIW